ALCAHRTQTAGTTPRGRRPRTRRGRAARRVRSGPARALGLRDLLDDDGLHAGARDHLAGDLHGLLGEGLEPGVLAFRAHAGVDRDVELAVTGEQPQRLPLLRARRGARLVPLAARVVHDLAGEVHHLRRDADRLARIRRLARLLRRSGLADGKYEDGRT